MAVLFNLEGPKGTGKSTFITKYVKEHPWVAIRKFDSDTIVSYKDFEDAKTQDLVFDRGVLSYQLYDWLWNNGISEKMSDDFSYKTVSLKMPINKSHFDYLMSQLKYKLVIFYSSDDELLTNRINKRLVAENKGANQLEWDTLVWSNHYYYHMGSFLKMLYPDKVVLYDVNNGDDIDTTYRKVLELIND